MEETVGLAKKVLLIANPTAQCGKGLHAAEQAFFELQHLLGEDGIELRLTEHANHAAQIAAECTGFNTVIALGGDGIIHEAANGLMKRRADDRPIFGIIPVGSGNDYARTLGMSKHVSTAVSQLTTARVRPIDVGCVNGHYFVETLSFGLDAAIALDTVERRKHTKKTDTALYLEAGINQLVFHLDDYHVKATMDDCCYEQDVKLIAVQNGITYGGGFKICPHADPSDGLLDICACEASIPKAKAIYVFLKAKDGKHEKYNVVDFFTTRTVHLEFDRVPPAQMDGERIEAREFDVNIHHHALNVLSAL